MADDRTANQVCVYMRPKSLPFSNQKIVCTVEDKNGLEEGGRFSPTNTTVFCLSKDFSIQKLSVCLCFENRKMLTPTFHFNILEVFFPIMCEQSNVLVKILREKVTAKEDILDVVPLITNCALDIICGK